MLNFKPTFSLSSFTFIKRLFNSSSLSAIRVVSSAYLRLLIFLLAILIPACASSSPVFQQYVNHELPDVQAGFRKGKGTRDQIANVCWIIRSKRVPEKHLFLLYWLGQSLWLCWSQYTVDNSERERNTRPPDLPLRNLYAGQEATVRTAHGTDWFQIGKEVCQGCILSPCLFNYM